MIRALAVLGVAAAVATALFACGTDAVTNFDGGGPLDAGTFEPRPPAACGSAEMLCSQEFFYPYAGESYVELIGSWGTNTWTQGIYMNHASNLWEAFAPVPYGQPVSYKFVIDGTTTVTDPGNSHTDANGNSMTPGLECPSFTCAEPPDAGGD